MRRVVDGFFRHVFAASPETPGLKDGLVDAIVAIALGVMIAYNWPNSSTWALGTLVGANLLMSGFSRLFYSSAVKDAVSAAAH